jgi:hypothetical protein
METTLMKDTANPTLACIAQLVVLAHFADCYPRMRGSPAPPRNGAHSRSP